MESPVVLDAGPLVAILNRDDAFHRWSVERLHEIHGTILTCEPVISETYFLVRHNPGAVPALIGLLQRGAVRLDFNLRDNLAAVAALMSKYADIPMSLADACLVRMTEVHEHAPVFTLDSDFRVYRRHSRQAIPLIFPN